MTIPRPVLALMARRHGLVTRGQLLARGCSVSDIDNWVHRGRLEALHRGVYRLAGAAVSPEQALLAAVLRAGTEARLAGEQALALYGIEGAPLSGTPTVLVPPARKVAGAGFIVRRSAVPGADRATVRGVPTLRVERAVLEVARTAGDRRVRQAVDSARWLGLLRIERLTRRAQRLSRHPGARRVRRLYAAGTFDPESEGERELQALLGDLATHFAWGVTGVVPGVRFDAYDHLARLALEYDGERDHTAQRDVFADRSRELAIRAAGIEVIRITKEMIRDEGAVTLARIRAVRQRRLQDRERRPG